MVGPAMDLVNNPLGAVRTLFENACSQSTGIGDSRSDWGAKELFDNYLHQQGGFQQVPEINSTPISAIPASSLVRFRGMVQDMFDIEYYLGVYKVGMTWRTTKFTDVSDLPVPEKHENQVWDRRLLYCVPVPGESSWVRETIACLAQPSSMSNSRDLSSINHTEKRSREPELEEIASLMKSLHSAQVEDVDMDPRSEEEPAETKRLKAGSIDTSVSNHSQALDLNMTLGESSLLPCLVKVYDGVDSDIRLNDVVEFTGVLTFDPELSAASFSHIDDGTDSSLSMCTEGTCSQFPANRVPRLHCITYRKLSFHKILEALPNLGEANACSMALPETVRQLRGSILQALTNVLGGDHLTAEYLLLHLLSQVYHRVDTMALGKISLNIVTGDTSSDLSSPLAIAIAKVIQDLLPCSQVMPLSLHNLNKAFMAPLKDYTTSRLVTGPLQLVEGTYLILDETALRAGQLNSIGIQNVQSLKYLMEWQKVEYDFKYYKLDMPTDIPVLIVSHAKSRLLPADVVVPIRSTTTLSSLLVEGSELATWRVYLSSVRNLEHNLDPSMQQFVENELVHARQQDRSLTPETFHRYFQVGQPPVSLSPWEKDCSQMVDFGETIIFESWGDQFKYE